MLIANCLLLKDFQNRHSVDQRKNVSADKTLPNTHQTLNVCAHILTEGKEGNFK